MPLFGKKKQKKKAVAEEEEEAAEEVEDSEVLSGEGKEEHASGALVSAGGEEKDGELGPGGALAKLDSSSSEEIETSSEEESESGDYDSDDSDVVSDSSELSEDLGAYAVIDDEEVKESGLVAIDTLHAGDGKTFPQPGEVVAVHYSATLEDGTLFESSRSRARPFEFVLGSGQVIQGWDEAIPKMSMGTRARIKCPHPIAYGEEGHPPVIPPKATLIFDIEIISFKRIERDFSVAEQLVRIGQNRGFVRQLSKKFSAATSLSSGFFKNISSEMISIADTAGTDES